jgi:hypothetical protein
MDYSIISANVRDDNDYLQEWIDYHLSIGFDKIIIYDHLSKDPVKSVYGPKVTIYWLERESLFIPEFIHNYTLKHHPSFWLAHFDVDEFIVLLEHQKINDLLRNYEDHGALGIPWSMFGSSGHISKPKGLVKDSYLYRRPDEKMWIKSIINTQFCKRIDDPHHGIYTRSSVNEVYEPFEGPITDSPRKLIKLNHYFTRSLEEYERKIKRGTGNPQTPERPIEWLYEIDDMATIYDDKLLNYDVKRTLE